MQHREFLERLYFKSLTPFEILEVSKQLSCKYKNHNNFDYLSYWKKTISKDESEDNFDKYCFFNNLNEKELFLMTSNIISADQEMNFPKWVKILDEVMIEMNDVYLDSLVDNSSPKPFYHFFIPFIEYFFKKISETQLTTDIGLIGQLKDILYNDLYELAYLVLFQEFKLELNDASGDFHYKSFIINNYKDKYQSFFLKYPMLARKLIIKINNVSSFIEKIFKNLNSDKGKLENLFDRVLGNVTKLYWNAGDSHNGESTVIIEFEDSYKVVYKPTNVGITNSYNSIIDWINNKLNEGLKIFNVLDKDTYGWIEFVEHTPCDTINDVKLYYERAGILLGVAHILNSKDFHYENVIASGNSPILIDHETILSPSLNKLTNDDSKSDFNITGTVLETSLIPTSKLGLPFFMYGLGSSEQIESNNTSFNVKNANTDSMTIETVFTKVKLHKSNKPIFNGIIENLIDYQVEFQRGFQKFYNLILRYQKYLSSHNSPLLKFSNNTIRFVNRHTKVYYTILKYLNRPEYLSDALKFGIKLEILARGYLKFVDGMPLLYSERMQMLEGNIPVFYIATNSKQINVFSTRKYNLIKHTAIENIKYKVKSYCSKDYQYQMSLISESIKL